MRWLTYVCFRMFVVNHVDTGRAKEKAYDPHMKLSTLKNSWISQASSKQRKGKLWNCIGFTYFCNYLFFQFALLLLDVSGRAGRTCVGVCFHLFSKRRHENMCSHQDSELLRMPLEELILQVNLR